MWVVNCPGAGMMFSSRLTENCAINYIAQNKLSWYSTNTKSVVDISYHDYSWTRQSLMYVK